MSDNHAVNEFRYASLTGNELTNSDTEQWVDIEGLTIAFGDTDEGFYLVTLIVPDTWNEKALCGARFRLVTRAGTSAPTSLGEGFYYSAVAQQRVPFSLAATAQVIATRGGTKIGAQWSAREGGVAHIGAKGLSSLSAVGAVT